MRIFLIILFCSFYFGSQGQTVFRYYAYLHHSSLAPKFEKQGYYSVYRGEDKALSNFFASYQIISFDRAITASDWEKFARVLILETEDESLANDLLVNYPSIFIKFEDITNDIIELVSYPNDYGLTSPNPMGAPINRNDLDYSKVPKAWDFTTGVGTTIGISDARLNDSDPDFYGKVTFINPSNYQSQPYNPNILGTFHGTGVAAIAAAQGNNNHGSTGICYDCDIIATSHGNYNNLLLLGQAGVKVINMSWASRRDSLDAIYEVELDVIETLIDYYNVVLVAAAGNSSSYQTITDYFCNYGTINGPSYTGTQYCFPASYNGVISVSAVNHKNPLVLPLDPITNPSYVSTSPTTIIFGPIEDSFGSGVDGNDPYNPLGLIYNGWARYCQIGTPTQYISSPNGLAIWYTSNEAVDILAPTEGTFSFHKYIEENIISYDGAGTSGSAPRVSGAAALMKNLNDCLVPDEVDDILKLTSKNVEQLSFNQVFAGQIGAGALDVGDAVEFVYEMADSNGNATIDNHYFYRFDFNLERINNKLKMENVSFVDKCRAKFVAKTQITLHEGTHLRPNSEGTVHLQIDQALQVCPSESRISPSKVKGEVDSLISGNILVYPNPNEGTFRVLISNLPIFQDKNIDVRILDMHGRIIYSDQVQTDDSITSDIPVEVNSIPSGIYFVTLTSNNFKETRKFIRR